MQLIELASRFNATAGEGSIYRATCPLCKGKMTLALEKGKVIISCRSQCTANDILRTAGLPYSALFIEPAVNVFDWDNLRLAQFLPIEQLLDPVISTGSLNTIFGTRGVGKSHVAWSMALAIAGGGKFLKWQAPVSRPVLYVDGEMRGLELQRGFLDCYSALQQDNEGFEVPTDALKVIPSEGMRRRINLATQEGQSIVAEFLADRKLVVVDNVSCLARGGPENDAASWDPILDWALGLRALGIAVLFVDHTGKNQELGPRGHSKKEDQLDASIQLKRPPGKRGPGLCAEVHFAKTRALLDDEPFEISLVTNADGSEWTWRPIEKRGTNDKSDVASALFSASKTVRQVADELGVAPSTAGRYRKKWQSTEPGPQDLN
jgi:AAA domain